MIQIQKITSNNKLEDRITKKHTHKNKRTNKIKKSQTKCRATKKKKKSPPIDPLLLVIHHKIFIYIYIGLITLYHPELSPIFHFIP